jgi:hypothetical protein
MPDIMKKAALVAAFSVSATAFTIAPMQGGMQRRVDTKRSALILSQSVVGDGTMVGDKGFDPLGFADSKEKLFIYREAELKHGRLAMLAALGWPVSEALDKPLASMLGMKSLLVATPEGLAQLLKGMSPLVANTPVHGIVNGAAESDVLRLAPSILNGGLQNVSPLFWIGALLFSASTEFYAYEVRKLAGFSNTLAALGAEKLTGLDIDGDGQVGAPKKLADDKYLPGDLGFDPLGLFKGTDDHKRTMQLKEINNGRLAMVAITAYAINEAVTKMPVFNSAS